METPGPTSGPDQARQADPADPQETAAPAGPVHLVRSLIVYTVLRVGLVVVLTAALAFFMPLIVALMFAIIVQLPLAWLFFSGPRSRVNDAIAVSTARRREERARLQSALTGEAPGDVAAPGGPSRAGDPTT